MFAFSDGIKPDGKNRAFAARAAVAAIVAALGGCASTKTYTAAQYSGAQPAANIRVAQTDVEDDGLPAQTPPSARARQMPDDPSEPFSRNYGGTNPSASAEPLKDDPMPHAPPVKLPRDLPVAFRQQLTAALAADE